MIRSDDTGKLILRLGVGVLVLLHGIAKIGGGIGGISGMLAAHGIPAVFAYLVFVGELLAPLLVIAGLYTRPAAFVMAIDLLIAMWLAHPHDIGSLNRNGGWAVELEGIYLFGALALSFLGAGRFSVGGASGRFN